MNCPITFEGIGYPFNLFKKGKYIMYEKVPKELKENGLFCLWRKEEVKAKITKVPYKLDGSKASANQRSHFVKFDNIVNHTKGYDGIGLESLMAFQQ